MLKDIMIDALVGGYISYIDVLTRYRGVFLMSKVFPTLLILGMILINTYFVWRGYSILPSVARAVDTDTPDIFVVKPPMNTTVQITNNTMQIHARVRTSDEGGLKNMYIVMAKKLDWSEEGTIMRIGSEEVRTNEAEALEKWPTIAIDISRETTEAKTHSWEGGHIDYFVDYVDEYTCVVDLNITIEDCSYYDITSGEYYWIIFIVEDNAGNFAWNSSLLRTPQSRAIKEAPEWRVIPGGSIHRGHPALSLDYPYIPYIVDNSERTWVIDTATIYGKAFYLIQFAMIPASMNATIRTREGIYATYGNTGAGFMAGFLLMIPWDEKALLDAFIAMGFLEFDVGPVVRFYLRTWSFFLTVWAGFLYAFVSIVAASLARRLRLKGRSIRSSRAT